MNFREDLKPFWPLFLIILVGLYLIKDCNASEYCDYTKEKADAERILLQSPALMVGFGRNDTSNTNTLGIGVTESLSKYLKGNLSGTIGQDDCHVYQLANELQSHVQYDLLHIQFTVAQTASAEDSGRRQAD